MSEQESESTRAARLRRKAARLGFILRKSRVRDPDAPDFGRWALVDDTAGNRHPTAQAWYRAFKIDGGLGLDDVEAELAGLGPGGRPDLRRSAGAQR